METSKPHVVVLSSPGLGHLIPVLELSKRLVSYHNFTVTIFVVPSHSSQAEAQIIQSATTPKFCDLIQLPPVDIAGLVDSNTAVVAQLCIMMRQVHPSLRSALAQLTPRPSVLVVDLFGTEALSVADEFDMTKYVYIATNAWFLALTIYVPVLDKEMEGQYVDQKELLRIPGCKPLRPEDVPDPMLDRDNQQYKEYVRIGNEIPLADGILVNMWEDLQATTLVALRDENHLGRVLNRVPVYTVGPLLRPTGSMGSDDHSELFAWLDKQETESVLYVSFGSGGTLSYEQMMELAHGLELSEQRFIWVARPPTTKPDGAYFSVDSNVNDPLGYLPEGFLTRTHDVGRVVPMWAPQADILRHPSVGGVVSHCGWNSTLESIMNGLPIIAWPLYSEQRMNATLLAEEIGVAIRPKVLPTKEVVGREEIGSIVRTLLVEKEGQALRTRAKELKQSGEKALSNGGTSYEGISVVAKHWEAKISK